MNIREIIRLILFQIYSTGFKSGEYESKNTRIIRFFLTYVEVIVKNRLKLGLIQNEMNDRTDAIQTGVIHGRQLGSFMNNSILRCQAGNIPGSTAGGKGVSGTRKHSQKKGEYL